MFPHSKCVEHLFSVSITWRLRGNMDYRSSYFQESMCLTGKMSLYRSYYQLESFPRVAITNYHELGLKQQKFIFLLFWRLEFWYQSVGRVRSFPRFWERICSMLFFLLLLVASNSWHSLTCSCVTTISAFVFAWTSSSVSLSLQPDLLLRTPVIGFGPPNPVWSHFNLITSAKTLFSIAVTFTGTGVRASA